MKKTMGKRSPKQMKRFLNSLLLVIMFFGSILISANTTNAQTSPDRHDINEIVYINENNILWEGTTTIGKDGLVVVNSGKSLTVVGQIDNYAGIKNYVDSGITANNIAFVNKGTLNFSDTGTTHDQSYIYMMVISTEGANNEHRIVQTMKGGTTNFSNTTISLNGAFGELKGMPLIWALPGASINFKNIIMEQSGTFTGPYLRAGNDSEPKAGGTINFYGDKNDPYEPYDNKFTGLNSDAGIRNNGTFNIETGTTAFINSTINLNKNDSGTWIIKDGATLVFDNTKVVPNKASNADAIFQVKKGGTLKFTNGAQLNLKNIGTNVVIKVEAGGKLILTDSDIIGGSNANIVIEDSLNDVTINTSWQFDEDDKTIVHRPSTADYLGKLKLMIGENAYNLGELRSGSVQMDLVSGIEIDDETYQIKVNGSGAPEGLTKCTRTKEVTQVTALEVEKFTWYDSSVSGSAAESFTVTNNLRMLEISYDDKQPTYNGDPHAAVITQIIDKSGNDKTSDLKNKITITYTKYDPKSFKPIAEPTTDPQKDAGTYKITASIPETDEYLIENPDQYLTIQQAELHNQDGKLYNAPKGNGTEKGTLMYELTFNNSTQNLVKEGTGTWIVQNIGQFIYYVTNKEEQNPPTTLFKEVRPEKNEVGTYYVYWKIKSTNPNYMDDSSLYKFIVNIVKADIAKAVITVSNSDSLVYDGTQKTAQVTVTLDGTTLRQGTDYTISNNTGTYARDYTLTITGKGSYQGTKNADWTIKQSDISKAEVTITNADQLIADGSEKTAVFTVTLNGKPLQAGKDFEILNNSNKGTAVSSYTLRLQGKGGYTGNVTKDWNIAAESISNAVITITSNPKDLVHDGKEKTVSFTVDLKGRRLTLDTDYSIKSNSNKATDVGNHTLIIEGKGNYSGTASKDWQITEPIVPEKTYVTITLGNMNVTYDGKSHKPRIVNIKDTSGKEYTIFANVSFTYEKDGKTFTSAVTEAGTYKLTVSLNYENFILTNTGPFDFVITQAETPETCIVPQPVTRGALPYAPDGQDLVKEASGACNVGKYYYNTEFTPAAKAVPAGYTEEKPVGKNAGTYTINWLFEPENDNYKKASGTFTVMIAQGLLKDTVLEMKNKPSDPETVSADAFKAYLNGTELPGTDYELAVEPGDENTWSVVLTGKGNLQSGAKRYLLTYDRDTDEYTLTPEPDPEPQYNGFQFYKLPGFWDREYNCPSFGCGKELPATGFPTRVSVPLSVRPDGLNYRHLNMRLQIPSLDVDTDLIGVPELDNSWAVEWIGDKAGLLSGTARPGEGYSIIAAHNHLNNTETGPFLSLGSLESGDKVFVNAADGSLISFSVYANELLAPTDIQKMASVAEQFENSLVLVTCENETVAGGYANRRVIFAKPY